MPSVPILTSVVVAALGTLVSEEGQGVNISDWKYITMQNNSVRVTVLRIFKCYFMAGVFPHPLTFSLRVLNSFAGVISTWMVKPVTSILGTLTKE